MHLQASLHHHANYLQWRRKSSRWRTTSCLTASSFRHRSWPQLRRSLSAVVVARFGWHGRSSAASARDGARSWEKATSLPRDRPTPGWTPSGSGKPQAHTRAEGGDGGGPKAEAHAKTRQRRRTRSTDSSREVRNGRGDHTHTHAERTYVGKVQTKVGVGNSQRLRARSPQHPTHAKRNRKRLRGVKRRVRGSATALQHLTCTCTVITL